MGNIGYCLSVCVTQKDSGLNPARISNVPPGQYSGSVLQPSEKNNDKFYYIRNEETIDQNINRLDELTILAESDAVLLDQTLSELRVMRRMFEPTLTHDSADSFYALNMAEGDSKSSTNLNLLEKKSSKKPNTFADNLTGAFTHKKKDIRNGVLSVEIQKAKFLETKLQKKYRLIAPYVIVKIHFNKSNKLNTPNLTLQEIKKFETLKNESAVTPEWAEVFEYNFVDEEKIPLFVVGISLYYLNEKDDTAWQIGDEEYFSLSSFLDQRVQSKEIDFKDPTLKGVLASLRVRFQFIYDLDVVKERLLREVKTRIEKLYKIRDKHPVVFTDRQAFRSIRPSDPRLSHANSLLSTSSNHDDDNNYYVD